MYGWVGDIVNDLTRRRFVHKNETCLWWSTTYHVQTPLENLGTGNAYIVIELKDEGHKGLIKKATSRTICWSYVALNNDNINTKAHSLECFEGPVAKKIDDKGGGNLKIAQCGGFFSVDAYLSQLDE